VAGGSDAFSKTFHPKPEGMSVAENELDKIMHIALPIGNGSV